MVIDRCSYASISYTAKLKAELILGLNKSLLTTKAHLIKKRHNVGYIYHVG